MKKSVFSYDSFRAGFAWILLFIGIVLYIVGFFLIQESIFHTICLKIADVIVIGVIVGYLSNAAQFLGVFKQDLQDLLYGKEFIRKRKDVYQIWETVSKELFKNRFSAIHKDFLKVISNYFPINDDISYYDDYETTTNIEWYDADNDVIKVNTKQSFDIITDSEKEMIFPLKTWTKVADPDKFKTTVVCFKINNTSVNPINSSEEIEDDNKCETFNYSLKGQKKYHINYEIEKVYDLKTDYILGFRAKYIVKDYRVKINCPDNIDLFFTCRGTQGDFQDMNSRVHNLDKKYKGIILPRQGFICALRKIN